MENCLPFHRHDLTDDEWNYIYPICLQFLVCSLGRKIIDLRQNINGILWKIRNGATWRDIPIEYGAWNTIYKLSRKISKTSFFKTLFSLIAPVENCNTIMFDSTSIKVHQHAAGARKDAADSDVNQHIGMSRGGKNTKIHALVNGDGYPLTFILTGGNINDNTVAIKLIDSCENKSSIESVLGDKAYGTSEILSEIINLNAEICIPPKENTKDPWEIDEKKYKERNLVERFFNGIKQFRGIATRYEKLASHFLSLVYLASVMVTLRYI